MEKKLNPNSHECLRRDTANSWSDLPPDLLSLVFEQLSFTDFQRAKSVCSSWHSASKQSVPKYNQIPLLILFPKDSRNYNKSSCMLFNPEEKDKLYKTQDLGLEFAQSFCLKTYGSWLLMQNPRFYLYVVNIFTRERINLPPIESQLGMTKMERTPDDKFRILNDRDQRTYEGIRIRSPVFWIDKKTKDYVVLWGLGSWCVVCSKKGDKSWNQLPETSDCCDLVYKDHKLYFLSHYGDFKIFDFSGEIQQKTLHCGLLQHRQPGKSRILATKIVVTGTGDVLKVERLLRPKSFTCSFRVFKIYASGLVNKHELINYMNEKSMLVEERITMLANDESILLDQGITVPANDNQGIKRSYIYFSGNHDENTNDICLFNLESRKMEQLHKFDCSSIHLSSARWFLPSKPTSNERVARSKEENNITSVSGLKRKEKLGLSNNKHSQNDNNSNLPQEAHGDTTVTCK